MTDSPHDRVHERIALTVAVEFRTPGAFLVAYSSNLSTGGMFVETERPLPGGSEVTLTFRVPGTEGQIEIRGVVAWTREAGDDGKLGGMGIRFAEALDARHGEMIDRIVAGFRGLRVLVLCPAAAARSQLVRVVRMLLSNAILVELADADAAETELARDADLFLVDLDETDAEGLLALRLAKSGSRRPIPVIATAKLDSLRARARELGADEVLANPPVLADLQAAVIRALGRPSRIDRGQDLGS